MTQPSLEEDPTGHLVLVVGPSGAGKDSIIDGARTRLAGTPGLVFVRRVVTRPSTRSEDNIECTEIDFAHDQAAGAFAFTWEAHGHFYGVPKQVASDIRLGHTVIVNVSRGIITDARKQFSHVTVVAVTAPHEILQQRIAARGRMTDSASSERTHRVFDERPDVIIVNDATLDEAVTRFVDLVTSLQGRSVAKGSAEPEGAMAAR